AVVVAKENGPLILRGQASHGTNHPGGKFEARLQALATGGAVRTETNALRIVKADAVTLVLAATTDYNIVAPAQPLTRDLGAVCTKALRAAKKDYADLRRASVAAH